MKKIVITDYKEFGDIPERKTLVVMGEENMEAQDGYHTFAELYDHRIELFITLCRLYTGVWSEMEGEFVIPDIWRSKLHHDGTGFDDWFILGIGKEKGEQITYHLPLERWNDTDFAETLEKAPEWDLHGPKDVLERLKTL